MAEYIDRNLAMEYLYRSINADADGVCNRCIQDEHNCQYNREHTLMDFCEKIEYLGYVPKANVVEVPAGGIGELSDGYHTFNGLYYQRMILFAALVRTYKDRAWKSYKHEDGEPCFGGGWFIVGIDTPQGSYTYHYENKYFDLFECAELPAAKHWDGHTEADVTRLMSLPDDGANPQER